MGPELNDWSCGHDEGGPGRMEFTFVVYRGESNVSSVFWVCRGRECGDLESAWLGLKN